MRIAYWTTDVVNLDLAARLVARYEGTICPLYPKDLGTSEHFDAELFDLDHPGPPFAQGALDKLLLVPPDVPVAVHSYQLDPAKARALWLKGIAVYSRLDDDVLRRLCLTAWDTQKARSAATRRHSPAREEFLVAGTA